MLVRLLSAAWTSAHLLDKTISNKYMDLRPLVPSLSSLSPVIRHKALFSANSSSCPILPPQKTKQKTPRIFVSQPANMRFGFSAAALASSLVASVHATYWCYSTETSCKSQLTDCAEEESTGNYCGNVSNKSKRSLWCYSSEALCDSQLNDCAYEDSLDEYCGEVTKMKRSIWCYSSDTLCKSELGDCEYDATTNEYCGNVSQEEKRSLWCYSSLDLCDSQLNDCEYYSSTGEYCGIVS